MKTSNPSLDQFSNHNCLIYGPAHGLDTNLIMSIFLKQRHPIADIVPHPPLSSDPDLILTDWCVIPRLLYPVVSIHFASRAPPSAAAAAADRKSVV